jgi:cytochrome c oxidase subunit IV
MASSATSVTRYIAVLAALIVLTVLTVTLSFVHLGESWHLVVGLVIAASKACLVLLFFMHAVQSPRATWCVIVVAILFLLIMFALTLSDILTRSLVPFMPGH